MVLVSLFKPKGGKVRDNHWLVSVWSQVVILQTTQTWANAGVCGGTALWVVHSTKRLVTLMLLKWFLSYSFIYFMFRMLNEIF